MLKISDLWNCAFLVCSGADIARVQISGSNGRRSVVFLFESETAEQLQKQFIHGQATANVTHLKNTMNHIKDIMFDSLREQKQTEEKNYEQNTGKRN